MKKKYLVDPLKIDTYNLSIHNGSILHKELLPEGVAVTNDAKCNGFVLTVSTNVKLSKPILLTCLFDESGAELRNSIILETGSSAQVLINYCDKNVSSSHKRKKYKVSDITEIKLDTCAKLDFVRLQEMNNAVTLSTDTVVKQAAYSRMKTHYIIRHTESVRNCMEVELSGVEAQHDVYGLSLTQNSEHAENDIRIVHASPDCISNQLFKHILSDTSTGMFTGRITVNRDSPKTIAYQRSNNILVSPRARMKIRPQLEIYADNVKCSHGATVGQLDAEAIFYLRSRGITEKEAKSLLLKAFAAEVIDALSIK